MSDRIDICCFEHDSLVEMRGSRLDCNAFSTSWHQSDRDWRRCVMIREIDLTARRLLTTDSVIILHSTLVSGSRNNLRSFSNRSVVASVDPMVILADTMSCTLIELHFHNAIRESNLLWRKLILSKWTAQAHAENSFSFSLLVRSHQFYSPHHRVVAFADVNRSHSMTEESVFVHTSLNALCCFGLCQWNMMNSRWDCSECRGKWTRCDGHVHRIGIVVYFGRIAGWFLHWISLEEGHRTGWRKRVEENLEFTGELTRWFSFEAFKTYTVTLPGVSWSAAEPIRLNPGLW